MPGSAGRTDCNEEVDCAKLRGFSRMAVSGLAARAATGLLSRALASTSALAPRYAESGAEDLLAGRRWQQTDAQSSGDEISVEVRTSRSTEDRSRAERCFQEVLNAVGTCTSNEILVKRPIFCTALSQDGIARCQCCSLAT